MRFRVIGWFDQGEFADSPTEEELIEAESPEEAKRLWRLRLAANGGIRRFDYITAEPAVTTVIHHRDMRPGDVFIGRPSIWGNPFKIGPDGDREAVIAQYRSWIAARPDLLMRIEQLRGKRLACFCAPLPCHGDVLAELADA